MCAHLELTQDTNPSLLRMVLLAVDHGLHWTIINLMPIIALALAETIWGHMEAATLVPDKPFLCSSAPSRSPTHRPSCSPLRSSLISTLLAAFLAVPFLFGGYCGKPAVGSPSSPIRWSSSTFIQPPAESSRPTAALRPRPRDGPGQFDRA
ncbi:hypothetical protein BKA70DRAFT_344105 [Coprinopsis sp. MPI-PUGE-AT-0042]|nr:hypothetical protein BKA70DRAFT_344105 [Coprinopsis sp. MPI-PUGE-AT-0042]